VLLLAALACGTSTTPSALADLTNPYLGPELSGWLIGPISRIASAEEIRAYLALRDDRQAASFVERFWESRNPKPSRPNPLLQVFEEREAEADRRFSEAGVLGRRTDRGTVWVIYGPPSRSGFESPPSPRDSPIELWVYDPGRQAGLDGKRPASQYRFAKRGDLTVTYVPRHGRLPQAGPPF
jgi:GWxTD domain-containing protein